MFGSKPRPLFCVDCDKVVEMRAMPMLLSKDSVNAFEILAIVNIKTYHSASRRPIGIIHGNEFFPNISIEAFGCDKS